MKHTSQADTTLLGIIGAILVVGLITLASASISLSEKLTGTPYYFLSKQMLLGVGIGGILFFAGLKIPISIYKKYAAPILIVSVLLLLLVFIPPIAPVIKGARRWVHIGPLSFQPSEILKLGFIIYLAAWLNAKKKHITHLTLGFLPFLVITGSVGILLILEPDVGTFGVIALTALGMFFLGGGKMGQIALMVLLGLALLGLLIMIGGYRKDRLMVFLNPKSDTQNTGYQLDQSLIAIGSGGFFGRGLGLSRQKFQYLPEPAGDAIFAIYAEEVGFLGVLFLFGLFIAFFVRGMMVAAAAKDFFAQLLAGGIVVLVMVQVLVNIAALSGLIPLTGIPLPFISYGGTALAFLLFEMGILLNISTRAKA